MISADVSDALPEIARSPRLRPRALSLNRSVYRFARTLKNKIQLKGRQHGLQASVGREVTAFHITKLLWVFWDFVPLTARFKEGNERENHSVFV
jgi:hypothetical protein